MIDDEGKLGTERLAIQACNRHDEGVQYEFVVYPFATCLQWRFVSEVAVKGRRLHLGFDDGPLGDEQGWQHLGAVQRLGSSVLAREVWCGLATLATRWRV